VEVCRQAGNTDPITIELRAVDFEGGLLVRNEWTEGGLFLSDQSLSYTFEAEADEPLFIDIRRLALSDPDFTASVFIISPTGETLINTSFTSIDGVAFFRSTVPGDYTARIDRTASEGGFEIRISDAPEPIPAQPFQPVTGRPDAGGRHVISFSAQDSLGLAVSLSGGFGSMVVRLLAESGGTAIRRVTLNCPQFGSCTSYNPIRILLPDESNFLLVLESNEANTSWPPSYSAAFNPIFVENIEIDQLVEGSLEFRHRIWYRFEASEGMIIRGGFAGPLRTLSGTSWRLFDPNLNVVGASFMEVPPLLGTRIPADGVYHMRIDATMSSGSFQGTRDFTAAVSSVAAEELDLVNGRAKITDAELPLPGSIKIYHFTAEAGAGLVGTLTPTGDQPLPQPELRLYRVGTGDHYIPQERIHGGAFLGTFMSGPRMSFRLGTQPDGEYLLIVRSTNDSFGSFDLEFDRVNPAGSFIVSADMECSGADTPALYAAALALQDNGSITVCEGSYSGPTSLYFFSDAFTLQGTDRDNVTIGTSVAGNSTIWVDRANATIENLTVEISGRSGFNSHSAISSSQFSTDASGLTVRKVRIYPSAGGDPYGKGISGRMDGGLIQNVEIRNAATGVELAFTRDVLLEYNDIEAPTGLRLEHVRDIEIRNNSILARPGTGARRGINIFGTQSGGNIIEDNIIRISSSGVTSSAGIEFSELGTSEQSTTVRRNQLLFEQGSTTTSETGIRATVSNALPSSLNGISST
jgi:hypothetical protein